MKKSVQFALLKTVASMEPGGARDRVRFARHSADEGVDGSFVILRTASRCVDLFAMALAEERVLQLIRLTDAMSSFLRRLAQLR
jgi:hypothetical protein